MFVNYSCGINYPLINLGLFKNLNPENKIWILLFFFFRYYCDTLHQLYSCNIEIYILFFRISFRVSFSYNFSVITGTFIKDVSFRNFFFIRNFIWSAIIQMHLYINFNNQLCVENYNLATTHVHINKCQMKTESFVHVLTM